MSWDSRDKPAPFWCTEYVITTLGRTSTGKRVYLSASSQVWDRAWLRTASVIQRYAVETVIGVSLSTRQPGIRWIWVWWRHRRLKVDNKPKARLCDSVHQMKTLRCCWVDFFDKTWMGLYMTRAWEMRATLQCYKCYKKVSNKTGLSSIDICFISVIVWRRGTTDHTIEILDRHARQGTRVENAKYIFEFWNPNHNTVNM